ncbi:uncharacterized protein BCR38DRAFT_404403 [Pseudomassariella vexata]|uniref:RING-type domain-containing protein n=1 Tax=Pseudomassariella vexata TaxID=1141098 RepID=A0A1Y2EI93_9PEZI|nr:uncharacterized protein BCR38DRAFT_404403 [Pseudomassariella vexata]ORY71301.1 hypothetical protein BCR38DRAFT_404403 [Pseudomassariella vexata]
MRGLRLLGLPLRAIRKLLPKRRQPTLETPPIATSINDANPKAALDGPSSPNTEHVKPTKSTSTLTSLEECPICHDPVGITSPEGIIESWTQLHCSHRFGNVCIQTWLQESLDRDENNTPSCPICRDAAKHPGCGHLVCPKDFDTQYLQYQMRLQWHGQARNGGRRQRRRLQRRDGHPLRPPPPPKRKANTVGHCKTCEENAAYEARIKQMMEERLQQAHHSAAAGEGSGRSGIKSYIPYQMRIRKAGTMSGEPSSPVGAEDRERVRSVICFRESVMPVSDPRRSASPAPTMRPTSV